MANASEILDQVEKKYGFTPNLFKELAKSPAVVWLRFLCTKGISMTITRVQSLKE